MIIPDWQPIETAPKDGTEPLVSHGEFASVVWWDEIGSGWIVAALADQSIYAPNPTHWMPLPAPPVALAQGDGSPAPIPQADGDGRE